MVTDTQTQKSTEVDLKNATHLEDQKKKKIHKEWVFVCTWVFIINWSEIWIIFQIVHLLFSDRRIGGWVEKHNNGTMRQKNIPNIPPKYPVCPYSPAHTQVVSLNLSDFRMEGWRGALGPHSNGTDKKYESLQKKRRGKLCKGGL